MFGFKLHTHKYTYDPHPLPPTSSIIIINPSNFSVFVSWPLWNYKVEVNALTKTLGCAETTTTILFANLKNVYKENRIKIDQAKNYSEYKAKQTSLFIMERW